MDDKTRILKAVSRVPDAEATLLVPQSLVKPPDDDSRAAKTRSVGATTGSEFAGPVTQKPDIASKDVIKGRFELEELLGVGGMGEVYKARDRRKLEAADSEPYVAIKLLNDEFRQHPNAFISLQRESRKCQRLAHPNIVTVYDFDRDAERVFMTMEYLEGAPLDRLVREHPHGLPVERAQAVLREISQALIYAHSHGIVHSDFKPGNIFVTATKGTKVFDFGIARAVSAGGAMRPEGEKTLFDAATLGALTPAYASYEMLKGFSPSPSDDVYALACVAYEIFSGRHPFDKVPADQVAEQDRKPERLAQFSHRQWRALARGLGCRREDRIDTVAEFYELFSRRSKPAYWLMSASLVAACATGLVALDSYSDQAKVDAEYKQQLQTELAQTLLHTRIADKRAALTRLVKQATLSAAWEHNLRRELDDYRSLAALDTTRVKTLNRQVAVLYLAEAERHFTGQALDSAALAISAAERWSAESSELERLNARLLDARKLEAKRLLEVQQARDKLALEQVAVEQQRQQRARAKSRATRVDKAVSALETALRCRASMNIGDAVAKPLNQLIQLDAGRAGKARAAVAMELRGCFTTLATRSPAAAEQLLVAAQQLLPGQPALANLQVDYCSHLTPGSGGKGRRYSCQDKLLDASKGPILVLVPAPGGGALAIAKYEATAEDLLPFCQYSDACDSQSLPQSDLPAQQISVAVARQYAAWLTEQTGNRYRLPTHAEWLLAAQAGGERAPADRNCHLKYSGIEKGGELVAGRVGKNNKFGLHNTVGNVREWVTQGESLFAAGGSRLTPMNNCRATTLEVHSGAADGVTGFRLVRELVQAATQG